MAGAPKTPARRSNQAHRAAPPFTTWTQLHLFVVVYVIEGGPEPGRPPESEPEPEPDQLTLPGFPEPATPAAHLAAMREALDRPRARKRPA